MSGHLARSLYGSSFPALSFLSFSQSCFKSSNNFTKQSYPQPVENSFPSSFLQKINAFLQRFSFVTFCQNWSQLNG
jgi:hypothetical protein